MSSFLSNLSNNTNLDIQRYNDYCEVVLSHLDNMKLRFNNSYITCLDIDIKNKKKIIDDLNIRLIINEINSIKIIESLYNTLKSTKKNDIELTDYDPLFLFSSNIVRTKNNINRTLVLEKFKTSDRKICKNIPKGLQLNHKQVFEMIYSEVDKVNKNMSYKHYIDFKDNDPYTLCFRFKYDKGELSEKLKILNSDFGFDYIEIILKLNNSFYPFLPPVVEYSKPCMSPDVIYNIKNSDIFNSKWNFNISLEWILNQIAEKYEKYFNQYIDVTKEYPLISDIQKNIYDLFNFMGINEFSDFKIHFEIPNFSENKNKEYWGSGTGYGYDGTSTWDINSFIEEQNNITEKINEKLENIRVMFKDCEDKENIKNIMGRFITNQLRGSNIFDFNKNINTYEKYINIISDLSLHVKHIEVDIIIGLYEEIDDILKNELIKEELDEQKTIIYNKFVNLFSSLIESLKNSNSQIVSDNDKNNYEIMVKENQFGTFNFDNKHLYYKYKDNKITNKKNLLRLVSEISSLKKNLPINWDTSCVLRIDKKQANMIKFIISGPKDTPYHNGLYEFHAYFPQEYPNVAPHVLLNTTDGGQVRFNPNLYASGKVCLSLLGTWSGQEGEKWNSEMSTFLQVIISIQSLIMVEDPYFNEPGYERSMHTESGKKRAFEYKDNIRYENLRVAILNQIKNPPEGFEDFTKNHFKAKRQEILETAEKWKEESTNYSIRYQAFIKHFNELLEN